MWADRPVLALIGRLAGEAVLGGGAVWGAFVALRANAAVFAWTPVVAAGVLAWLYWHDRSYLRAAQAVPLS